MFHVELTRRSTRVITCTTDLEAAETLREYLANGYPARREGRAVFVTIWTNAR